MKISSEAVSSRIAGELLRIGAVTLAPDNPYTWASGLRSPVYCDNRLALGYPPVRRAICEGLVGLIERHGLACDVIGGIATAGIPHAAWVADQLGIPMVYIRAEAKSHGKGRQIEGKLDGGQNVVLIEDLVSTGRSSAAAVDPIRRAGCEVSAVLAIFSYALEQSRAAFEAADTPLYTLTDFPTLVRTARATGAVSDADLSSLLAWHADPVAWSDRIGV